MRAVIKIIKMPDETLFDQEETELELDSHSEALDRLLNRLPRDLQFRTMIVCEPVPHHAGRS